MVKVAIFDVKYSPNLGDGVLAECLERFLEERTGCLVRSIDLAGRSHWKSSSNGRTRALLLTLLQRMPRWLRDVSVTLVLGRRVNKRLRPEWIKLLKDVDFAIFGGGQLFQDADLNFPIKIAAAASECEQRQLPMAVFGVGVAPIKSKRSRLLLERLLGASCLVYTAVRDERSRDALSLLGCEAELCRDPGLLATRVWPAPPRKPRLRPLVGLCMTHPAVLRHHASRDEKHSLADVMAIYADAAKSLVSGGFDILCFTNGASEDEMLLASAQSQLLSVDPTGRRITFAQRCATPHELSDLIAKCDAIIAHRLHAAIIAYSHRVPSIGLQWG